MTLQIITVLFFFAVFLALIALYMGYAAIKASPRFELRRRLKTLTLEDKEKLPSDLSTEIMHETSAIDKFFFSFSLVRKLDKLIDSAGSKLDVKIFVIFMLVAALAGFTIGLSLRRGMLVAGVLFLIAGAAPLFYLRIRRNMRLQKFTEQFPDALDMIARSLRAGHAFSSAIQLVGSEMSDPLAGLFRTAYEEQTLGLSIRDAFSQMLERTPSMDLRLFVTAVNVHREVGGNLADTLERLGQTIRDRIRIRRQVRVYTAQGRLSGYILAALPIFMATFLYFFIPDYIEELVAVKTGWYIIGVAVAAQITGFFVIRKLINIKI
ncbi:MAG TPA: type II secretion system F family protein [Thermodesulfovibrionales bacterium]|nr:type II secretion system F family protein [Thermodesulfovibrionales bacterium]